MRLTRRQWVGAVAAPLAEKASRWTAAWDRAIVAAAVDKVGEVFDPAQSMVARRVGPEYHYHTNVRDRVVHPTRESLEYALLLLEAGESGRAARVIDRVVKLQETDPGSKWYGLWGYYLEEPAPQMSPADWNWADFLGALLLEIEFRHGARLRGELRQNVREAIRHTARSVRRRNVSMNYTNIAVQGTFVTLAAAELLGDADLKQYATERLERLRRVVDETGSFAEYNSPTYAHVTIANLTRMRMFVKDAAARKLAQQIEEQAWLHVGAHWHKATRQLAGPMSRCYQTDIGRPAWLQKALGGDLPLMSFAELRSANVPGEVGILAYRCPEHLSGLFLNARVARQHRELFQTAPPGVRPVQGTTWLDAEFCLGSVNRGNFWIQSRPLLAYWGGARRPARYLQARVLKDDYDFASGLLYSVQQDNFVLGVVAFRFPGGDKHPNLDPVKEAQFRCSRLRLRFDLAGVPVNAPVLVNGEEARLGEFPPGSQVAMDVGGTRLWVRSLGAMCGEPAGRVTLAREEELLTISVDLLNTREPRVIRWPQIMHALFALAMQDAGEQDAGSLEEYDRRMAGYALASESSKGLVRLAWKTPAGALGLEAMTAWSDVAGLDRQFRETLDGAPVPVVRLSL